MLNTKKTVLVAAVVASLGAGAAQAAPVVNFGFVGEFVMLSAGGGMVGSNPVTGSMTMDMGTGAGSASIAPGIDPNTMLTATFFGYTWTAHNISLQAFGPGTVHASMLFDWGVTSNISVTVDFSMTPNGVGGYTVVTLDSNHDNDPNLMVDTDADGIPDTAYIVSDGVAGNWMNNGPFVGFNATFNGTATPQPSAIPVPAAVWLLGSGLLGMVGVARRKKAA